MTVFLPVNPEAAEAEPRYVGFGGEMRSSKGGPSLLLNWPGDRWALDVQTPPMLYGSLGRVWVSRLVQGKTDTVAMRFPQPGYDVGLPGSPVVDGAGQSGQTLDVRGLSPLYLVHEGQFFSIIVGGQRYLYNSAADVVSSETGTAALIIRPMIRKIPPDGAVVELAQPIIEGHLQGREQGWTLEAAKTTGLRFSIMERA
jgi:hypothetical protein